MAKKIEYVVLSVKPQQVVTEVSISMHRGNSIDHETFQMENEIISFSSYDAAEEFVLNDDDYGDLIIKKVYIQKPKF